MTATATTGTAPRPAPAHRDGNVLRWLAAYTASMLGDTVYFLALGFAAARIAPPAQVGLVMAAGAVPRAALMLGGGVIADRFGPRRVVIGSDAVRCVLILGAAAGLALASPGVWLLVALALAFGVVDALFMPAVGALPPRIVAPDQIVRLQGLRALSVRLGAVAGPPAGGLAMGLGGPATAFAVAGALFATSVPLLIATLIAPLPGERQAGPERGGGNPGDTEPGGAAPGGTEPGGGTSGDMESAGENPGGADPAGENPAGENPGGADPGGADPGGADPGGADPGGADPGGADAGAAGPGGGEGASAWRELVDGLRYVRGHRLVGPLILGAAICEMGLIGPLNVGMVLLSQERGWGSAGYGWIIAAFGAGAAASALALAARARLPRAGAVQIGTLFVSSATLGLIGVLHSLAAAVAMALLTGLISGVCGGLSLALIQTASDPGYLGRVTAVTSLSAFGLAPLAYPVVGAAFGAWGPGPVFLSSAAFGALGGVIGLVTPAVRRAELPTAERATEGPSTSGPRKAEGAAA